MEPAKDRAEREAAALEKRLSQLRKARRHLAAVRGDEDHQARWLQDGLERHGGQHRATESRLSLLDAGRRLTRQALDKVDKEIAALEQQLAERGGG